VPGAGEGLGARVGEGEVAVVGEGAAACLGQVQGERPAGVIKRVWARMRGEGVGDRAGIHDSHWANGATVM
jgi:hypothetical protein